MADARLKHKPNEKHTLDEVLKSLQDLVRNEVLDKPAGAPAFQPKSASTPATTMDMHDIISSLENLLADDVDVENKTVAPPKVEAPIAKARAPKTEAETPAPPVAGETPAPEPTGAAAAPASEPAVEEPPAVPAKSGQQELPLAFDDLGAAATDAEPSPPSGEIDLPTIDVEETPFPAAGEEAFASDMAADLETIADEILAAPAPPDTPPAADAYTVDFTPDAITAPSEDFEVAEDPSIEATPAPNTETVEYTPPANATLASDSAPPEDPPSPVQDEPPATDEIVLDLAEPPQPEDAPSADSGSTLGGVVEFDLSSSTPGPAADSPAPADDIPVLEDVALAPPKVEEPAPASPSSSDRAREMAVKVIAKLNIELRKAGKQPLDVKTINRLQQLLREAMGKQ